jgi:bilirubin oxidase
VWLNKNEEVDVIARYAPWDGLYMVSLPALDSPRPTQHISNPPQFHCHNVIHEDHVSHRSFQSTIRDSH